MNSVKMLLTVIAAIVAFGLVSIAVSTYTNNKDHIDIDAKYVMEQCSIDSNAFPESMIIVEFIDFKAPFLNDVNDNVIHHSFRFENISGEPLDINFTVFYEKELDEYIVARDGVYLEENRNLTLKNGEGYHSNSIMSLLYSADKYDESAKKRVNLLSSKLYVEMKLNTQKYYFILDFNNKTVDSSLKLNQ